MSRSDTAYLETTKALYQRAADIPEQGLCCTTTPAWKLPGLEIPKSMLEMNYGCGSTVHMRDLEHDPTVLYLGVGGGMELLQFSYFTRRPDGVIGLDVVDEMLEASQKNFREAESVNSWFDRSFVSLKKGDALDMPIEDASIDVAAQNCLFNIFKQHELERALSEMYRVLKPGGRLVLSDPVCEQEIPEPLRNDEELRARCISGARPLQEYLDIITGTGFGTVEIRARRPYRVLSPNHFEVDKRIYIESVEICAFKDPVPDDGPCIFTGKTAIYVGDDEYFDDGNGHLLENNRPLSVCDKTAANIKNLDRDDIFISDSTWFYDGGGCC